MLKVEVWFDLICPWCLIGKRNLDATLEVLHTRRPGVAEGAQPAAILIAAMEQACESTWP